MRAVGAWIAAFASLWAASAAADTYRFDPQHTSIRFSWDHLGMSRQQARFTAYEGTLEFDTNEPEAARVAILIKTASVESGVAILDERLRSAKFFEADVFPEAAFVSSAVRRTGERTAVVTGNLSLHGTTRPVDLDVRWNHTGPHPLDGIDPNYAGLFISGFSVRARLQRSAFGLTRHLPIIPDQIEVEIETELIRTGSGESK